MCNIETQLVLVPTSLYMAQLIIKKQGHGDITTASGKE
jgi:hypothetical protein